MRILWMIVVLAACGNDVGRAFIDAAPMTPCQDGAPGLRITLHMQAIEGGPPAQLLVTYAGGSQDDLAAYLPPSAWTGDVTFVAPITQRAQGGPASFFFTCRPDPLIEGGAQATLDLARCNEVEIDVHQAFTDAGPDATP